MKSTLKHYIITEMNGKELKVLRFPISYQNVLLIKRARRGKK